MEFNDLAPEQKDKIAALADEIMIIRTRMIELPQFRYMPDNVLREEVVAKYVQAAAHLYGVQKMIEHMNDIHGYKGD